MKSQGALLALLMAASAPPVAAHHSETDYESAVSVFSGELVDVRWVNPHILLTISDGTQTLQVEWMTLTGAALTGVGSEQFETGKRIAVSGSRHRNPQLALMSRVRQVDLPDENWQWKPPVRGDRP